MEIQDLSYENLYRKPIIPPERPSALLNQDSENPEKSGTFRVVEDVVEISAPSEQEYEADVDKSALLQNITPYTSEFKPQSIDDLRDNFAAKSAELSNRLQQFYSAQGIRPPVAADLTIDAEGRIIVAGNLEQRDMLESQFVEDPVLQQDVEELANTAPLLRAAEISENFAKAYDQRPESAVAEYPQFFSDSFKFNFHFEDLKLSGEFKSDTGTTIEWWQEP